jgi:hypothetical protein
MVTAFIHISKYFQQLNRVKCKTSHIAALRWLKDGGRKMQCFFSHMVGWVKQRIAFWGVLRPTCGAAELQHGFAKKQEL